MPDGGSQNSTVTQNNKPWKPAQDDLRIALNRNQALYNKDRGGQDDWAQQHVFQDRALDIGKDMAMSGAGTQLSGAGQDALTNLVNNPYGPSKGALTTARNVMGSNPYAGAQDLAQSAATGNPYGAAQASAAGFANADPYAGSNAVFDQIESQVMPRVNAAFGASGRTGSGLHQDAAVKSMTEAFSPFAANMYQQDQNRALQATGLMGQLAGAEQSGQFQGAGLMGQLGGAEMDTKMAGAGLLGSLADAGQQRQLQGAALGPTLDAAQYADVDKLYGIGSVRRDEQQFNKDRDYNSLLRFSNLASQIGGMGGSSTQTQQLPGQSPFQTVAGLGLAGLGAATGNPFMALGGFGSLFG